MKKKNNMLPIVFAMLVILFHSMPGFCQEPTEGLESETVWKWQQTLANDGSSRAPKAPSHYTISFKQDGKLNIRADCNRAGGTYTEKDNRITIEVTHSTMAMCPPDSLEGRFLKDLNAAAIYFFKGEHLFIDLKYDSGTMKFAH